MSLLGGGETTGAAAVDIPAQPTNSNSPHANAVECLDTFMDSPDLALPLVFAGLIEQVRMPAP